MACSLRIVPILTAAVLVVGIVAGRADQPGPKPDGSVSHDVVPLPDATTGSIRSVQLEQVAQQADRQTWHGIELAGRGAHFAARVEFLGAMRLLAEALDAEQKTSRHAEALSAGWTALRESDDFLPDRSRCLSGEDVAELSAAHETPVLKNREGITAPMTAMQAYLTFAQEQFSAALEHEVAGSMALHAMGKLYTAMAQKRSSMTPGAESKAVVFFQASLLVYPSNYMAANDFGVLLARGGRPTEARAMLRRSVAICPQSAGWHNLAVVHRQLGEFALAEQAEAQSRQWRQAELARSGAAGDRAQWLDPRSFARASADPTGMAAVPVRSPVGQGAMSRPEASSQEPASTPAAAQRQRWAAGYSR
ncbi:MAG: tetratricopeptide repeat protein [Planctomycetaceae bacterium]|nr:tetratricopeptide repeat protein [Planctomycetaceae bacterium]